MLKENLGKPNHFRLSQPENTFTKALNFQRTCFLKNIAKIFEGISPEEFVFRQMYRYPSALESATEVDVAPEERLGLAQIFMVKVFCGNNKQFSVVKYFCKKLHHRCLT